MSYANEFIGRASFHQLDTITLSKDVNTSERTITFTTQASKLPGAVAGAYSLINEKGEKADVLLIDIVSPTWDIEAWKYKGRFRGFKIFLTILNQ